MNRIDEPLVIVLVSIHGLIRGHELELGRDADTGGQTKYVVELARALGQDPRVDRVDLLTQRVDDARVSEDYAEPIEELGGCARIVRIPCGDGAYLPKEELWDSLDNFVDDALQFLREQDRPPHLVHGHYADAGYAGLRLAGQLGVPFAFTGHSLGRVKRRRLLAAGVKRSELEDRYRITRRIAAEEGALGMADLVITSTRQEVDSQYELYDYYRPEQMKVVPPGVDLERFHSPSGNERRSPIYRELKRFLHAPEKPMILAVSRPDERKNITALIETFGTTPKLRQKANLVVVAGNRDDIAEMDAGAETVLTEILLAIDRRDLYGAVAYPKHHRADDVPLLYRLAALSGGVFVNPALTEPFGLTLLEAAASGLPVVATDDGGPVDIIDNCRNGYLIDPLDRESIAKALLKVLTDDERWLAMSVNGLEGVRTHYSWEAHTRQYLDAVEPLVAATQPVVRPPVGEWSGTFRDRAVFTDLDKSLLGDPDSVKELAEVIKANRRRATFGIATGRRLDSALKLLRKHGLPRPDVLITSLGTDIYYAPNLTRDTHWREHIDHLWNPRAIRRLLADVPGLKRQPPNEQGTFKISYYYDPEEAPSPEELNSLLLQARSDGEHVRLLRPVPGHRAHPRLQGGGDALVRRPSRRPPRADPRGRRHRRRRGRHARQHPGRGGGQPARRGAVAAGRRGACLLRHATAGRRHPRGHGALRVLRRLPAPGGLMRPLLLCTDLDRTLLPNGPAPESPRARPLLRRLAAASGVTLVYVTGRDRARGRRGDRRVRAAAPGLPDHRRGHDHLRYRTARRWSAWDDHIAPTGAGVTAANLARLVGSLPGSRSRSRRARGASSSATRCDRRWSPATAPWLWPRRWTPPAWRCGSCPAWTTSRGVGLIDVLPAASGKAAAIEFLRENLGLSREDAVCAGDSGNDMDVLVGPLPAVLVANAADAVREAALDGAAAGGYADRLYLARGGLLGLNGNYAAGILEGVLHYHPERERDLEGRS